MPFKTLYIKIFKMAAIATTVRSTGNKTQRLGCLCYKKLLQSKVGFLEISKYLPHFFPTAGPPSKNCLLCRLINCTCLLARFCFSNFAILSPFSGSMGSSVYSGPDELSSTTVIYINNYNLHEYFDRVT